MSFDEPKTKPQPPSTLQVNVPTLTPASLLPLARAGVAKAKIPTAVAAINFIDVRIVWSPCSCYWGVRLRGRGAGIAPDLQAEPERMTSNTRHNRVRCPRMSAPSHVAQIPPATSKLRPPNAGNRRGIAPPWAARAAVLHAAAKTGGRP